MEDGKGVSAGRIIGKRYELFKEIGKGGMARVSAAREVDPGGPERHYAIKEPLDQDRQKISRFYREARAHWLLRESPYIVRMHGFEHPDNNPPYLVLELMLGGSLKELLGDFARFRLEHDRLESGVPRELALRLAWQAVCAVRDMHHEDFAHRDLKPSNLLLLQRREQVIETRDGTLKLSDLGIVDEESAHGPDDTQLGGMVGTWQYAPPEYLKSLADKSESPRDTAAAKRGDIFALGLIMHEIWMGVPLYKLQPSTTSSQTSTSQKAQNVLDKVEKGLQRLKAPENKLREDEDIYALLVRMLERSPSSRPSIDEVESTLRGMLREVPAASTISATNGTESALLDRVPWLPGGLRRKGSWGRAAMMGMAIPALALAFYWFAPAWTSGAAQPNDSGLQPGNPAEIKGPAPSSPGGALPVPDEKPAPPNPPLGTVSPAPSGGHGAAGETSPQKSAVAAASNVISTLEDLPDRETADRAFVQQLKGRRLKQAAAGKASSLEDPDLVIRATPAARIAAPARGRNVAQSTNTTLPDGTPTLGLLLRHGSSHYYTLLKGFRESDWLRDYGADSKLGYVGQHGTVVQKLLYCEKPVESWTKVPSQCRAIVPRVWLAGT